MAGEFNNLFGLSPQELPYNLEAEQSVLGALLIDPDCIYKVIEELKAESFYRQQHREIFSIIIQMFLASEGIDFVTVLERVCRGNVFDNEQDAKTYLAGLVSLVPTSGNVSAYAKIVREKYYLRSLITTFEKVLATSREGNTDPNILIDMAEQGIYDLRQGRSVGFTHIKDVIAGTYDRLQRMSGEDRSDYVGIPTGFPSLDHTIMGLNKSDLLILAARPGMGKTAFALNLALNVAKQNKTVAIFSLEMGNNQLVERLIASEGLVSSHNLHTGNLSLEDWEKIAFASQRLSPLPIYLDDAAGTTVGEMKAKLRRLKNIGFVVVDYLQLVTGGDGKRRSENRVNEVSEMTRNFKIMAKELNVPVLVLSQLSRGPEARTDKRPMLSDLRESGSIEQDADIVMMLYRAAYYYKDDPNYPQGEAECIVAKNRHGTTANVPLGWDGEHTVFTTLEKSRNDEY